MNIILNDYRREILNKIRERVDKGGRVYIYGAALRGKRVREYLLGSGIKNLKEYVVDDNFLTEGQQYIIPLSQFNRIATKYDVLVSGFESYSRYCNFLNSGKILKKVLFVYFAFPHTMNTEFCYIDDEYYKEHKKDFLRTYSRMSDDSSKYLLKLYIESQITGDVFELYRHVSKIQYFDSGIPDEFDFFVDCGGYTGDTLIMAYEYLKRIGHYYLFEPDTENLISVYDKLHKMNINNISIIKKGVYSKETTLKFLSNNMSSRFDDNGDVFLDVTTLDKSIVIDPGRTVYIKMDIEGSELPALQGAIQIIKTVHPYMAISVYHKRDDLFAIPDFISEVSEDNYNYILKYYGDSFFCELVLYCFPKMI